MWPLHFPHVTRPWSRYTCFFVSARLWPERRFSPRRSWTLSNVSFETIGSQFASTTRYRWLSGSLDWSSVRFFLLTSFFAMYAGLHRSHPMLVYQNLFGGWVFPRRPRRDRRHHARHERPRALGPAASAAPGPSGPLHVRLYGRRHRQARRSRAGDRVPSEAVHAFQSRPEGAGGAGRGSGSRRVKKPEAA